jgi:hypothetical protein
MDDLEFRTIIKQIISDARTQNLEKTMNLLEYGDEFGDVDLGGWKDLMGIIGNPSDVLKTTAGSIANVSNKIRTLLTTVIKGIPTLVIPFVELRYDKIYRDEQARQQAIERMYPEIFAIARKSFPDDAKLFAFMLNPVMAVSTIVSKLGADLSLDLIDALSGNAPDIITRTRPLRRRAGINDSVIAHESLSLRIALLERPFFNKSQHDDNQTNLRDVEGLFDDQDFIETLEASKPVHDIIQAARDLKNETLNNIIDIGEEVSTAEEIDDLKKLGLKFNVNVDQLKTDGSASSILVQTAKNAIIDVLIKRTEVQIDEFKNLDIPESSDLYKVYTKSIERLKSMKEEIPDSKSTERTQVQQVGQPQRPPVA